MTINHVQITNAIGKSGVDYWRHISADPNAQLIEATMQLTLSWREYQELLAMSKGSFTCPRCGLTSHNQNDVRESYCGHCHVSFKV